MFEKGKTKSTSRNLPDYGIAKLSGMGMLGFLVGLSILFYTDFVNPKKRISVFHEIKYAPAIIIDSLLKDRAVQLIKDTILTGNAIAHINKSDKNDSTQRLLDSLKKIYAKDTTLLFQINAYRISCSKLQDTTAFKTINAGLCTDILPQTIDAWDCLYNCDTAWKSDSFGISFKDSKIDEEIKGRLSFSMEPYKRDIDFIAKYPLVGIWLLLILTFYSFCFMAVPLAIELKKKVLKIFATPDSEIVAKQGYYWVTVSIAVALALFIASWLTSFYDKNIIKDIFFMCNLSIVIILMTIVGVIAGSFCLAGFIYTSSMLTYLSTPLMQSRKEAIKQQATVHQLQSSSVQSDIDKLNDEQSKLNEKENEKTLLEMRFTRLSKIFQTYFILAASILSLMVLCTGTLFSATNSLDFIKLITDDWGYSPARNDFVYLYAGLYTIILLMVYIPAKMKFSDSEIDIWNVQMQKDTNRKSSILKNPFDQFKGVLVAVSPLIVSIVQSLLDLILQ